MGPPSGGGGAGRSLSERIELLFTTVRRPDRTPYSNEEVARACRESTGESFSATYLWQLRTGRRDNPAKRHLEALAAFFRVPVAEEVALLSAMRDAGVRDVALRAVNLSPDGLGTVKDLIEAIARREAERRRPSS
ncbi:MULTISPECIES: helix-turn-helix domain-containing protein [Streptomyces]|uniref:helix-turn-helix domain-containing protein n=1 Tax=Streptomyces TaxID=1883 RepID=UPI00163BCF6B|nr:MULTISPECIES: helix-turn-helix domain-containing protein [Streptomyces]MBC2878388.1 XRE family transcriptional regulator [Streptomyces sp. TYQ1024]UBI41349.1 helix-turn-helix domain-containing protein [Streptomyces mobaraensis]UKW33847.1 helix-turn-helix domain-containing protein [Streptomyces sp. TYQ1024]